MTTADATAADSTAADTNTADTNSAGESATLDITGMTCASCANRIERKLNKLDGVQASVNFATERAFVTFPAQVGVPDLVATVEAAGYGAAEHRDQPEPRGESIDRDPLLTRLVVSALLAVPLVIGAMAFDLNGWIQLALATPVATWGAWEFHRAALINARHGSTTMDTLVSIGVTAAYGWSVVELIRNLGDHGAMAQMPHYYFEVAAVVTTFLLLGRWLERRAKRQAGDAMRALISLGATQASVLRDGVETKIGIDQLSVGDLFVVRPGDKVATDGEVVEGTSAIDAAMLTGESVPVEVGPGDRVVGATINAGGRLVVRATGVGADTQLAAMARLVDQAQSGKAEVQRLADRVSAIFVPTVLVIAAATAIGWLVIDGSIDHALTAAVAVLIVACPCALGLATPTALMVGTGRGASLGILIRGPEVLESTRIVDTVVLDKTGTLTTGVMRVTKWYGAGTDLDLLRSMAGAVEAGSEHPIARAIVADAGTSNAGTSSAAASEFRALPGLGATAEVDHRLVVLGRPALLAEHQMPLGPELAAEVERAQAAGSTVVAVGWDGQARGVIEVADSLKPDAADAVARLKALGLTPILLTGDNQAAASAVAAEVGIPTVIAEVMPADKLATIERLQGEGRVVAMVGDGINDAAALAQADLGIAMGTGTDVAMAASDITLVSGDPGLVADAISLARRTLRIIKQNLVWAFGYNVIAIPLAAAGLLNPMLSGAAMAASSVSVVANSLRLRRFTP